MSINASGNLIFECDIPDCQKKHSVNAGSLNWEIVDTTERKMGAENTYESIVEVDCHCGNPIRIEITVWEYPIGCLNNGPEYRISGANIISEPSITITLD